MHYNNNALCMRDEGGHIRQTTCACDMDHFVGTDQWKGRDTTSCIPTKIPTFDL